MALFSLLFQHPQPFPPPKPNTKRLSTKPPTHLTRDRFHPSNDYRLSWQNELKRSNGPLPREKLGDEDFFQTAIDRRAVDNVRMLIVDAVQHAKAGHPGMALGMAEVGYHLYRHVMRYNPKNPKWFNRDRFVLSAGHGCLLQYVCLHLAGFESVQVMWIVLAFCLLLVVVVHCI